MGKNPKKKQARQATKVMDKELHKSSKVIYSALGRAKPAKQMRSLAGRAGVPRSLLLKWADAIARPFEARGAICPVNFNPTPSLMMTTATTTYNSVSISVAASTTSQWVFYPGHGAAVPTTTSGSDGTISSSMDGTAYHAVASVAVSAGSRVHIGPTNMTAQNNFTFAGSCVLATAGLTPGGATNATTGAVAGEWDESLPYSYGGSTYMDAGHLRWQCVSVGVRFINQTPEISRGGNVVSVQLVNNAGIVRANGTDATQQGQLEHNPSFKLLGVCDELTEVAWTPRVNDLAYWHSIVPGDNTTNDKNAVIQKHTGAGFVLFFNNPTGSAQTYAIQVIYNWMLAGNYLASVSVPAVTEPILRAPVEQTVVQLQNSSSTAAHAPVVAAAASTSAGESEGMVSKLARAGFDGLTDLAHQVGKAFAQEASQQVAKVASATGQRMHKVLYPGMPRA